MTRIPFGQEHGAIVREGDRCHHCSVRVGGFHHLFCDVEECPKCYGQALHCDCSVAPDERRGRLRGQNLSPAIGVYYLADVMRLTQAKRSSIENWVRSGWLTPEGPSASGPEGTGHHRTFSFANLVDVSLGIRLNRFHIPLATLFRSRGVKTLRDLVPQFADIRNKSNDELAKLYAKGLTRDDWQDFASGRSKAEYLAERVAQWRTSIEQWCALLNPATRPVDCQFVLQIGIDSGGRYWTTWSSEPAAHVADVAVVINMGTLLEDLERATGDHWGI